MKTKAHVIDILTDYFRGTAEHFRLAMVFLYGSWAKGNPTPDSDIDIGVVLPEETLSEKGAFDRITSISSDLSRLFSSEVNVISIHRDFRHPMLYYNAIVNGIPIYVEKTEEFIPLKMAAIHQMEDFSIFGRKWQLQVTRRNMEALKHARLSVR